MSKWHIYFWEPVVSPHKVDLFNALRRSPSVAEVWYVAQDDLPLERVKEGWAMPDFSPLNVILSPSKERVREIMESSSPHSIHLFSGTHWVPCIVEGIKAAILNKRRFGIMTEPRASEGVKGRARFLHSWLTEGPIRKHADFILAIGRNGPPWFRSVGYAGGKIFPFAYFVPGISPNEFDSRSDSDPVRVTWLARTIKAKGIHLFLNALPRISIPISVEAAGVGDQAKFFHQATVNAPDSFIYHGALPMAAVPDLLRRTDILVLPSITTNDGWGVVVSEALMAGAAVVATDKVGASICLNEGWRGSVVRDLSGSAIADAVNQLVADGLVTNVFRGKRSRWANARLTGTAGAKYLLAILEHLYEGGERPRPFYAD